MQLSSAPTKLTLAFANSGQKNTVPVPSQIGITPGAASYTDGFPPLTMTPVSQGGVPPSGLDFNGVLNEVSAPVLWQCAGASFPFDSTFAAAVGGYPIGAQVLRADGTGYWFNTIDNNSTNPDTGATPTGWNSIALEAVSAVYAAEQNTAAVGTSKILFDTVEFDSRGLWNAAGKHFLAPWAGKYRFSGSVYLPSPAGQNLATQVWHNGTLAKQCFMAPQVSNVGLSLPFGAVIQMAAGDYVDAYLDVTQTAVAVGQVGSNQAYVYAQIEYLGQ